MIQYKKLEAEKQGEVDLLNPAVAKEIGENAPLIPKQREIKRNQAPYTN